MSGGAYRPLVLATLLSATLHGVAGRVVRVEVDVAPGLPGFTIVGLPDAALSEARERVRGALRNTGFHHPPRRITVNLAPAEVRKAGASLDLAIALGILLGSEQLRAGPGSTAVIGELGLGGEVRRVPGILPMCLSLGARDVQRIIVPREAAREAMLAPGVSIVPVGTLAEAVERIRSPRMRRSLPLPLPRADVLAGADTPPGAGHSAAPAAGIDRDAQGAVESPPVDLADVRGQAAARRALEIALAGGHAMLLVGPPGAGKTLLARTIPALLPDLDDRAALAATIVASVASEEPLDALVRRPPVRAPHHTISYAGMVGGGPRLSPGEVSLAHQGVLVCDELPEFGRDVLEALRQPLEEGSVSVVRVGRAATFPARFTFVAAMNPCPCGQFGSSDRTCTCPPGVPDRYLRRISGPLRDRIDLWVTVDRVAPSILLRGPAPEGSSVVAARIEGAQDLRRRRTGDVPNGRIGGRRLHGACRLDPATARRAALLAEREGLSGRGTDRLLRVARTIADLAGEDRVLNAHLDEAAWFRAPVDRSAAREAG
jgi:magnesium chelatase family protein